MSPRLSQFLPIWPSPRARSGPSQLGLYSRCVYQDIDLKLRLDLEYLATFLARLERSHDKIVDVSQPFLGAASRVLVHGKSRLVAGALTEVCKTKDIEVSANSEGVHLLLTLSLHRLC